jgi:hypothetical protein
LLAGILGVVAVPAGAHTPYRQWQVYRQRHLVIGASREDAGSYPKAKELQAFLEEHLPEASARVARARTVKRLADLLATDQLKVALLSLEHAEALMRGEAPFAFAVPDLRALARFGKHVLCARGNFPDAHAWLLASTFAEHDQAGQPTDLPVPVHTGVDLALAGKPMPPLPDDLKVDASEEVEVPHRH